MLSKPYFGTWIWVCFGRKCACLCLYVCVSTMCGISVMILSWLSSLSVSQAYFQVFHDISVSSSWACTCASDWGEVIIASGNITPAPVALTSIHSVKNLTHITTLSHTQWAWKGVHRNEMQCTQQRKMESVSKWESQQVEERVKYEEEALVCRKVGRNVNHDTFVTFWRLQPWWEPGWISHRGRVRIRACTQL